MYKNKLGYIITNIKKRSILNNSVYDIIRGCTRFIHDGTILESPRNISRDKTSPAISAKYEVITETNSPVIEHTADEVLLHEKYSILSDEFDGINLESKFYFFLLLLNMYLIPALYTLFFIKA